MPFPGLRKMAPVDRARTAPVSRDPSEHFRQCPSCEHGSCPVREHGAEAIRFLANMAGIEPSVSDARALYDVLCELNAILERHAAPRKQQLPSLSEEIMYLASQTKSAKYERDHAALESIRAAIYEACPCLRKPRKELVRDAHQAKAKQAQRATLEEQAEFERALRNEREHRAAKEAQAETALEFDKAHALHTLQEQGAEPPLSECEDTPCLRCKKYGGACKAAWDTSSVKNALHKVKRTDWCPHAVFGLGAAVSTLDETLQKQGKPRLPEHIVKIAVQMKLDLTAGVHPSRSAPAPLPCSETYERNSATLASIHAAICDACQCAPKPQESASAKQALYVTEAIRARRKMIASTTEDDDATVV